MEKKFNEGRVYESVDSDFQIDFQCVDRCSIYGYMFTMWINVYFFYFKTLKKGVFFINEIHVFWGVD